MPVDIPAMQAFEEITERQVTLTAEGVALPADPRHRTTVVDAIADQLGAVLLDTYGASPRSIQATTGHHYHAVADDCPACGTRLRFTQSYLDAENGAQAVARCRANDCFWTGQAIYRLVDLEGGPGDDHESAVLTGAITPTAVPY